MPAFAVLALLVFSHVPVGRFCQSSIVTSEPCLRTVDAALGGLGIARGG